MLVSSLRQFGGAYADLPVWIYVPEQQPLTGPAWETLQELGAEMIPFVIDEDFRRFPFAAKSLAAAVASGQTFHPGAP